MGSATAQAWEWTKPDSWEIPILNESLCTGCGDCVRLCPTDCLEMDGPVPWLPRPGACISCSLCVLICPTRALTLGEWTASAHQPEA